MCALPTKTVLEKTFGNCLQFAQNKFFEIFVVINEVLNRIQHTLQNYNQKYIQILYPLIYYIHLHLIIFFYAGTDETRNLRAVYCDYVIFIRVRVIINGGSNWKWPE